MTPVAIKNLIDYLRNDDMATLMIHPDDEDAVVAAAKEAGEYAVDAQYDGEIRVFGLFLCADADEVASGFACIRTSECIIEDYQESM